MRNKLPRLDHGQTDRGRIQGPEKILEYRLEMPPRELLGLAVVCHPHPLYQGTMDNKVVYSLARAARACDCAALRFQFRGVGDSEGPHDQGRGEARDTAFLLQQLRALYPRLPAFLLGFSFGSYVALKVASEEANLRGFVAIAPPLSYAGGEDVPEPACPWLVVHGRDDEVVPYAQSRARLQGMRNAPELVSMDGTGHFFHGRLGELREVVEAWLARQLPAD